MGIAPLTKKFVPSCIELLHIVIETTKVGIIKYGPVDASDPEEIVVQESNLSSSKKSVSFLSFLFL